MGQHPILEMKKPATPAGAARFEIYRFDASHIQLVDANCFVARVPASFLGEAPAAGNDPAVSLLEDGQILGPPSASIQVVSRWGAGRYKVTRHPESADAHVHFSSSDGTDPRANGRSYSLTSRPLSFAHDWQRLHYRSWLDHSRWQYFLSRGGDRIPPPLYANLGITDICNLKCSICGSQNMLTPVSRRHMDYQIFKMVADTLFPLLTIVELNSRGEPLLHPRMADMLEIIRQYNIFLRLQTNGTQFQSRKLQVISQKRGEVSISIDATGELFEYARAGARWSQVDQGVRDLLGTRDRDRLGVYIYPTLTARTIKGARDLIAWAMAVGIDRIDFHLYDPIQAGKESAPSADEVEDLKAHASSLDASHPTEIRVNYSTVKTGTQAILDHPRQALFPNMPVAAGRPGAHPVYACMAPVQSVDLDLDGCVSVCCQMQQRKLGNALTVEAFADCWFGAEYQACRSSLAREHFDPLFETCRGCVQRYAG